MIASRWALQRSAADRKDARNGVIVLPQDCHHCIHYFVTWDENFPHGCRAMGFKSWRYPGDEVRMVFYGRDCLMYKPKKRKAKGGMKQDRN